MYKVKGNKTTLPVTSQEVRTVLANQRSTTKAQPSGHALTHGWDKRIGEERIQFLSHLLDGKPMTVQQPLFEREQPRFDPIGIQMVDQQRDETNQHLRQPDLEQGSQVHHQVQPNIPESILERHGVPTSNIEFLNKLNEEVIRARALEQVNSGRMVEGSNIDDESADSIEEERKKREIDQDDESEKSVHSKHDSVNLDYGEYTSEELRELVKRRNRAATAIQAGFRARNQAQDYQTLKNIVDDQEYILVSRHFKKILFRRELSQLETWVNYLISFRLQRRARNKKNRLGLSLRNEFGSDDQEALEVEPFLKIYLKCNSNFHLNCETEIDIERSLIDKSHASLKAKLTMGGLAVICHNLLDNMFIVSHSVYFHANLPSMINSELEIVGPPERDEQVDEEDQYLPSSPKKIRRQGSEPYDHLKDLHVVEILQKLVFNEIPNRWMACVIRIQRFLRRKFKNQKSRILYPRDLDEEMMQNSFEDGRLQYSVQQTSQDPTLRKVVYSCITNKDDKYVHITCLINKKSKAGEVHAYDFTDRVRMKPLTLEESVLFTTDLCLPEIFSKIELDFKEGRVTVTQFNKFQIQIRKYLKMIFELKEKNLQKLIQIQAFVRGRIQLLKYAKLIVAVRREKDIANFVKIITRFYIVYDGISFLVTVGKKKHDPKIVLKAFKKAASSRYRGQIQPLELHSTSFKDSFQIRSDEDDKDKTRSPVAGRDDPEYLLEYVLSLKGRVTLQPFGSDGLCFNLQTHKLDKDLKVKNGTEVKREEFESKAKANQIDTYLEKKYNNYLKRVMVGEVRAQEFQTVLPDPKQLGPQQLSEYLGGAVDKIRTPVGTWSELVDVRLGRTETNDHTLFSDEMNVMNMIVGKYIRTTFMQRVQFSKTIRGDMQRERQSRQGKPKEAEDSRNSLSDTSTCEYICEVEVPVQDDVSLVTVYFDVRYNDIVYSYMRNDKSHPQSCELHELGLVTRDVEVLKDEIPEKASDHLVWDPETQQIVPLCRLSTSSAKMAVSKFNKQFKGDQDSLREDGEESRHGMERPVPEATSFSEDEEDVTLTDGRHFFERLKHVQHRIRWYCLMKKLKNLCKIHVESCKAKRKLIAKSFFISSKGDSFTVSISFSSQQYAFEIAAHSWEAGGKSVAAKLDIDVFCRLFGIKRLPEFGPQSSASKLREIFGNELNVIISKIRIESTTSKTGLKIVLDWDDTAKGEEGNKSAKETVASTGPTPAQSGLLPTLNKDSWGHRSRFELLIPISGQQHAAPRAQFPKQKYVSKPIFTSKMTPDEMTQIFKEKIIKIQSFFRRMWTQRRVENLSITSKLPSFKVKQIFRKYDQCTAAVSIVYDKLAKYFKLFITLQEYDAEPQFYTSGLSLDPLVQDCYGNQGRMMVNTSSRHFYHSQLPELASELAERMEFYKTVESQGQFLSKMNFKMPFQLPLETRKKQATYAREEEVEKPMKPFDVVLTMAIKLQRYVRRYLASRAPASSLKQVRRRFDQASSLGKIVLLTFKKISGRFYQVWVYEKSESEESYYNFVIIPKERSGYQATQASRISYKLSEHKLLNSHGLQLLDYLLEVLKRSESVDDQKEPFYFDIPKGPNLVKATKIQVPTGYVEEVEDSRDEEDSPGEEPFDNQDTYSKVTCPCNLDQIICPERHRGR